MPKIKIERVVSFSSEDSVYVANNILSNDSNKKWKCHAGEKQASLVLQLEKASIISSIDIGNENSAYIEVLVSRSSSNDDFKVLLVMSSFMTPLEARQSTNINKVRMFSHDQLSSPERNEKWDRVKVVCTQPFNRHVQYGLSFINLHSHGEQTESSVNCHIGKFTLRPNSPDNISLGSLFARRKDIQENTPLKPAAAIRNASASLLSQNNSSFIRKKINLTPSTSNKKQVIINNAETSSRNRHELLYTKDDDEPNKKIDEIIEKNAKEKMKGKEDNDEKSLKNKIKTTHGEKHQENVKAVPSQNKESTKRKLNGVKEPQNKKIKTNHLYKPFHQLLDGVVLVISGIQNPDRANIRTMALSMGAKYKTDWDTTCTHLICAFLNTPKFNQVKEKGKIVTKSWISDCHSQRKKLPWRRYALDKNDRGNESEEEVLEKIEQTSVFTSKYDEDMKNIKNNSDTDDEAEIVQLSKRPNFINLPENEINSLHDHNGGGSDTEDEIERIQELEKNKETKQLDPYDVETDEEDIKRTKCLEETVNLPDFFSNKIFYIDSDLSKSEKALLMKYIIAFKGLLTEDLNNHVDIVISSKELKFKKHKLPLAKIVSSDFVWECHNSQTLLPIDSFKI